MNGFLIGSKQNNVKNTSTKGALENSYHLLIFLFYQNYMGMWVLISLGQKKKKNLKIPRSASKKYFTSNFDILLEAEG